MNNVCELLEIDRAEFENSLVIKVTVMMGKAC